MKPLSKRGFRCRLQVRSCERPKFKQLLTLGTQTRCPHLLLLSRNAKVPAVLRGTTLRAMWHQRTLDCRSFYDRALAIDVREYSPYIIAEVSVEGKNLKEAIGKGFKQVWIRISPWAAISVCSGSKLRCPIQDGLYVYQFKPKILTCYV